jgi:hypothetical protein
MQNLQQNLQPAKDNRKKPPPVSMDLSEHQSIVTKDNNAKCILCRLDHNIERQALVGNNIDDDGTRKETIRQSQKNMWTQLLTCTTCRITAHPTIPSKRRRIHGLSMFKGLTCFQIAHTKEGYEVLRRNNNKTGRAYNPQMKHPICQRVREMHGLQALQARKRKRNDNNEFDSD